MSAHGYGPYCRGCRCEVCRQAKADYMRVARKRGRERAAKLTVSSTGKRGAQHNAWAPGSTRALVAGVKQRTARLRSTRMPLSRMHDRALRHQEPPGRCVPTGECSVRVGWAPTAGGGLPSVPPQRRPSSVLSPGRPSDSPNLGRP